MIRYRYLHSIHCIFHRVHRGNVVFSGNSQDLTEGPLPKQKKLRTNVASLWWTRILEKSSEFLVLNAFQEQYEAIWRFGWNLLWGRLQSLEKSSICSSSTFAAEISMQFFIIRVRLRDWATASMPWWMIWMAIVWILCAFHSISPPFHFRNPGAWGDARTCLLQPFWGGKGKERGRWVKDGERWEIRDIRAELESKSAIWCGNDVEIFSFLQFFTFSCVWAVWILNHFSFGSVVWLRFAPSSMCNAIQRRWLLCKMSSTNLTRTPRQYSTGLEMWQRSDSHTIQSVETESECWDRDCQGNGELGLQSFMMLDVMCVSRGQKWYCGKTRARQDHCGVLSRGHPSESTFPYSIDSFTEKASQKCLICRAFRRQSPECLGIR